MYTLIGTHKSRAFRVLWMLEELELEYSHVPAPPHDPVVNKYNPLGRIPVLLNGEDTLRDSTVIMNYLADRHGQIAPPAGSIARAETDALTHQILDEFDGLLWTAARHTFILPEDHRVPEIKPELRWEFHRNCDRIAERLEDNPFLMGDDMTIPDIVLTHCLGWAITAKFGVENDVLRSYLNAMKSRPAYVVATGS
ncbi:MAG: glutathione S-transferase family protein [Litoreibacter sp.]